MNDTQRSWTFTPDEFAWVWGETGRDEYPEPIAILETPTTEDEYAVLCAELSQRYPRDGDPDRLGPLRVLAEPDLRLICSGTVGHPSRRIRSVGAAIADLGVVLFQKPGTTPEYGGDIIMRVVPRDRLADHIAATLPPSPAGATPQLIGHTPRVRGEEPPERWGYTQTGDRPAEERIRSLLRAPRAGEGYLCVEHHPTDPRRARTQYLNWIDIHERHRAAGRYVISVDANDTVVTPASSEVIGSELRRRTGTWKT
ncbi:ESX secretion-associated protein EspG [Nocardia cyriacigeorgica]|uniref:ESX secretion-associated protein EspG n=1 Tax=Nocardia cyriacigeorgica TaxID=135487 RepID=UPI000559FD5C|nr:ESX secretion-associated protein EspG [Nocardia cyriacigeorgica]MBF6325379.1 ESX secretion-associated protein EspG [Nocardia cyriacigeorgica]